ncbi:MAG TPA: HAD-IA family hydrolase [Thermoanaerobaculia bacterium]|nr:HAD-IA family hydrolase [Thermoanaerobaculia bacterium]
MSLSANSFRLLVFDWDGTLMDSIGSIVACTRATLEDLGLPGLPDEKIRGTIGLGLRETVDVLWPGGGDEVFSQVLECYRKHWLATWRDLPILFEGVPEMLAELAADGYLLAVATGKSRRGLDHVLEQTGLADLFHATRTVDEAFSKPHPQMLLDILDELGVPARDAVMIGDTTYDLEMARSAGTASVGVCTGSHCREDLERFGPVVCLDGVVGLREWLVGRWRAEPLPLGSA